MALKKAKPEKETLLKNSESEQVESLRAQLARALADYDNLRRRTDEEKQIWFKVAGSRVIEKFLGIYDMLVSAQSHLNDQGLGIVLTEFKRAIEEEGYEEVRVVVDETDFDSNVMEVIEAVPTEAEDKKDKVAEVLMVGWKAKNEDAVLRHAKVKVYKFEKQEVEN